MTAISLTELYGGFLHFRMGKNTGLDEAQAEIKIAGRNINNLRCADDTTHTAEKVELITLATTSITPGSFSTGALNSWHLYDDSDANSSLKLGVILETA